MGSSTSNACADADPGHFVPTQGQLRQTACAVGTYQPNPGRASCNDADQRNYTEHRFCSNTILPVMERVSIISISIIPPESGSSLDHESAFKATILKKLRA